MERPIVLTVDEVRTLKELAERKGVSVGYLVRQLIAQEALRHDLPAQVEQVPAAGGSDGHK